MVTRLMALVKGLWHSLLPPVFRLASDALLRFTRGIGSTVRQVRDYDWRRAKLRDFRFLWRYAKLAAVLVLIAGAAFYLSVYFGLFGRMPSVSALKALQNHTASEVYSADSVLLGRYYIQDRTHVPYEKISPDVIKALVATEDVRFYEHSGVDPRSLARVVVKTLLLQRESSGGGSTISQQLAKNLYPRRKYRLVGTSINKLQEMIIARRLESIYSKPQILELYLNTVPMGDLFGIERAAERFFSTDAGKLSTEQAAVLVGMLKANTSYNPKLNPERSKQRRNVVLGQMAKYGYLEPSRADSLKQVPIKLRYRYENHNDGLAPYFREQLRKELAAWCARIQKPDGSPYNLYTDGLRIYTTIHSKMQAHAEQAVRVKMAALQQSFNSHWKGRDPWDSDEVLLSAMRQTPRYRELREDGLSEEEILEDFRKPLPMQVFSWKGELKKNLTPWDSLRYYQRFLNTGLISMEPRTGYVRAWVGGIDHEYFKYDHVRAKRQAGSTFKPVVYAAALEQGIEPCTYFPNTRDTYAQYDNWSPRNADGHYGGEYSMRGALAHSVNTVSAKIIVQAGIGETIHLARRLGIQSDLPEIPGLALGVAEISLMEMVSAYTTFISNGYQTPAVYITSIVDRTGKVLRQHQPRENRKQVISYANADVMIALLQGVVEEGSAARLRSEFGLSMDIAGKTGTTQNHADGWFIGITPELVTGVWVGAESPTVHFRTLALGQGAATALPVWADFMARLGRDRAFRRVASSRFRPLPPHLQERLQCDSFLDDTPVEEETEDFSLGGLVDRIFSNGKKEEERNSQEQERARQEQQVKQNRREEEKQRREEERRRRKERRRERRERNN